MFLLLKNFQILQKHLSDLLNLWYTTPTVNRKHDRRARWQNYETPDTRCDFGYFGCEPAPM